MRLILGILAIAWRYRLHLAMIALFVVLASIQGTLWIKVLNILGATFWGFTLGFGVACDTIVIMAVSDAAKGRNENE